MALPITQMKGDAQTPSKGGSPSRLKTGSPKQSPGREAFGNGSMKQNHKTVRSELRKKAPSAGNKRF
jgi:hypothetical protein